MPDNEDMIGRMSAASASYNELMQRLDRIESKLDRVITSQQTVEVAVTSTVAGITEAIPMVGSMLSSGMFPGLPGAGDGS